MSYNKCLDYITDICENNYENYFYTAIANIKIVKNYIYSNYIKSDINPKKQNLTLLLLLVINNIKAINLFSNSISLFIEFY